MAEIQSSNPEPLATPPDSEVARPKPQQRGPPLHQVYALPAPIRTFPLPAFYPNNPLSLFHVVYAWLGQVFAPPPVEPAVIHQGVWSEATSSVHITDEKSTRALWEQGFYGKGSLSRSEPNWLKREEVRQGLKEGHVSEIMTVQRREERVRAKWERARQEQEAIRQTRLEEARQAQARLEAELEREAKLAAAKPNIRPEPSPPVSPAALLALPNSIAELERLSASASRHEPNGSAKVPNAGLVNGLGSEHVPAPADGSDHAMNGAAKSQATDKPDGDHAPASPSPASDASDKSLKRRKSVRFSPTVESTTFGLHDPPSPNHSATLATLDKVSDINGEMARENGTTIAEGLLPQPAEKPVVIVNKEHLQLMPEEAFFLSFGLGALQVTDPAAGKELSSLDLFHLFRRHSYFPPRTGSDELQPDDTFLVHYAVYHHFRSLGWVPRGGIKFGVDWLLYTRGPVFDHAEFGLIVMPSFSDPLWEDSARQNPQKTWQWLHGIVRVLSHVTKSLVLVYVDVPPPSKFEEALEKGFSEVFKLYTVREVMVKRWSSNRNR